MERLAVLCFVVVMVGCGSPTGPVKGGAEPAVVSVDFIITETCGDLVPQIC